MLLVAWGFCSVLFSLKKRLFHGILIYASSLSSCFLVFVNLHMICIFGFLRSFSVIVRGTSFTGLSDVFIIYFVTDFCSRTALKLV